MRRTLCIVGAAAAVLSAGCGDETSITAGGRIAGTALTVYSALPSGPQRAAAVRETVLGEKLALAQAGGRAGAFTVDYVSVGLPAGRRGAADAVRDIVRDPGVAAVIGDLTAQTARTSVPLLDAAGILHVSPTAPYRGAYPSGRRTSSTLLGGDEAAALAAAARGRVAVEATAGDADQRLAATVRARVGRTVATRRADTVVVAAHDPEDAFGVADGVLGENRRARVLLPAALWQTELPRRLAGRRVAYVTPAAPPQPGFAAAFRRTFGRDPGPWAQVGHDAMRAVLDAIRRAGDRATSRRALIDAFLAGEHAPAPYRLATRTRAGEERYAPLR